MLLALGAASAALDAIQSLTTPKRSSSSQGTGFGSASTPPVDGASAPGAGTAPVTGFTNGPQISPDNINALLSAQSESTGFNGSDANSLLSAPPTFSNAATSAYNAIDQLVPGRAAPVPHPPASLSLSA
jgi:hypothetical protein